MGNENRVATRFLLQGLQEWGQSETARIAATQALVDAAGFDAKATCAPVFGGIWPKPCEGYDGHAASLWLLDLTETMPRGKFEREVEHIENAIKARGDAGTFMRGGEPG